jgi:hypothetical protein
VSSIAAPFRVLVAQVAAPVRALLVALAGVGLGWLWFHSYWYFAMALIFILALAGWSIDRLGYAQLPHRPVRAIRLMEWWITIPAVVAAAAAGIVIVITVKLTVPDTVADDTKELFNSLSTGITTFITAALITWSGEEKDSKQADHIQDAFFEKYKEHIPNEPPAGGVKYFKRGSRGLRSVYSQEYAGIEGWGKEARMKRARIIAEELASGNSDPPPDQRARTPLGAE